MYVLNEKELMLVSGGTDDVDGNPYSTPVPDPSPVDLTGLGYSTRTDPYLNRPVAN